MYFPEQFILVAKVRNGVLKDKLGGKRHTETVDICEINGGKSGDFKGHVMMV